MTKEELEKEAEEWLCNNLHSASEEDFIKAMVDIAEPREKRIAELEKKLAISEHDREHNDYELAEVYKKVSELEKEKCELLGIIQGKDKAIKDLEWQLQEVAKDNDNYQKENAELKEELKAKQVVLNDFKSRVETVTDRFNRKSSQLTYAKTIIQDLLDNTDEYARQKAEDFLKESK